MSSSHERKTRDKKKKVYRSTQTPSPLFNVDSVYLPVMHLEWHDRTILLKMSATISISVAAASIRSEGAPPDGAGVPREPPPKRDVMMVEKAVRWDGYG
jgi:hypothetical protein